MEKAMFGNGIGWKLITILVQTVIAILGAEAKIGKGNGPKKRAHVLATVDTQARNLGLGADLASCGLNDVIEHIGGIVDHLVTLLNCLGIFKSSGSSAPSSG